MTTANIQIGSNDLTSMMVQVHIEKLNQEEKSLREKRAKCMNELDAYAKIREEELEKVFSSKLQIQHFVAAFNALMPPKSNPLKAVLDVGTQTYVLFGGYIRHVYHNQFITFKEKYWKGNWTLGGLAPLNNEDEDEDSVEDDFDPKDFPGYFNQIFDLKVKIPQTVLTRINITLKELWDIDTRLEGIRNDLLDVPNLERKVSAALTQQFLKNHPDLIQQVNSALTSTGANLLLEVQSPPTSA